MDIQATKLELMELLLTTQKEKVLQQIKDVFEQNKSHDVFFHTSENQLQERITASEKSIEQGNTRSINDFKKEVEEWKQKRAI